MDQFILALDQGTTSCRALVFDKNGSIVSTAQKEFTQYFPEPGWVEHDALEIWSTQLDAYPTFTLRMPNSFESKGQNARFLDFEQEFPSNEPFHSGLGCECYCLLAW